MASTPNRTVRLTDSQLAWCKQHGGIAAVIRDVKLVTDQNPRGMEDLRIAAMQVRRLRMFERSRDEMRSISGIADPTLGGGRLCPEEVRMVSTDGEAPPCRFEDAIPLCRPTGRTITLTRQVGSPNGVRWFAPYEALEYDHLYVCPEKVEAKLAEGWKHVGT